MLTNKYFIIAFLPMGIWAGSDAAKPLVPNVYSQIPLGSIKANGWLRQEMQTEANGLAGHLYDFWQFVHQSSWLGGTVEYSELNEAFPYWLNGLTSLAYGLDDSRLKGQVHSAMDYVLAHMIQSDGWVGPEKGGKRMHWARTLVFWAWTNIADANSTYTAPVVTAMHNYNKLMVSMLQNNGTGTVPQANNTELDPGYFFWGRGRVQDLILSPQWLYDYHPNGNEAELLQGMQLLHKYGWNWEDWYVQGLYPTKAINSYPASFSDDNFQYLHGVNVAEGLKAPAVIRRYTYNDSLIQTAKDATTWTFQYHGNPMGSVIADEGEEGLDPWSGSELCTAVELIFSQSYNFRALGDSFYADSAELSAFNALPGALTGDWWAHQYMSQPNQPFSKNLTATPFGDVNTMGQTFGLEPNYPCCTVNHAQGLPRFLQASFMGVGSSGLVHALLAPASVQTQVNDAPVTVNCTTNYPFEDTLFYDISAPSKGFDFYVRVPTWAASAAITDQKNSTTSTVSNGLIKVAVPKGITRLMYTLKPAVRTTKRENDAMSVYRGQLLYAIPIAADITSTSPHNYYTEQLYPDGYAPTQSRDYTMLNATAWNIAIDPKSLQYVSKTPTYNITSQPQALPSPIFAPDAPPNYITAQGCYINWPLIYSGSIPGPPPTGSARKCIGSAFQVKLVPYGSAKLHMAEIPTISL